MSNEKIYIFMSGDIADENLQGKKLYDVVNYMFIK